MIGHHTCLRENEDVPLWRAPTIKKKPPCFHVRALITRVVMHSKDGLCNIIDRLRSPRPYSKYLFVRFVLFLVSLGCYCFAFLWFMLENLFFLFTCKSLHFLKFLEWCED